MYSDDRGATGLDMSVELSDDLGAMGFAREARLRLGSFGAQAIVWIYSYEYETSDSGRSMEERKHIVA